MGGSNPKPRDPARPACRHCQVRNAIRRRNVCFACSQQVPGVWRLYRDAAVVVGRTELDDFNGGYVPPDKPTAALPGTRAKMKALARRVKARRSLHHPGDARRALA